MPLTPVADQEKQRLERRSGHDRRASHRRRAALPVPRNQRDGGERRHQERRLVVLARAWHPRPQKMGYSTDQAEWVRIAVGRVAAAWQNDHGDAVSPSEITELLGAIARGIRGGEAARTPDPRLRSVLGRRLLELVRAELIRAWSRGEVKPTPEGVLARFQAVEWLRSEIEPDWSQYFASRLSGPGGLDLVVEMVHDFRSPLTSILFLAETMQRGHSGPVSALQDRQLGLVYGAAFGLSEMSSNVIEMARGGQRLTDEELVPFSVSGVLESVRDITSPIAEEKGLAISVTAPAVDYRLGHPLVLSRVLLNLTTNALKFTERGQVEIAAHESDGHRVEFSVRDTGPGISPACLDTLYTPFRRAPGGERYAFSSTGLGLGLCRRLVEALGSELRLESQPGAGTRFSFDLTLQPAVFL